MKMKKQKVQKKCVLKRKLKFKDYKNFLKASEIENKINYGGNKKIVDCLKADKKDFLKNKLMLKTQQRF